MINYYSMKTESETFHSGNRDTLFYNKAYCDPVTKVPFTKILQIIINGYISVNVITRDRP